MRYQHIIKAIASQPWAMHPDHLRLMVEIVGQRIANGGPYTAQEIEAKLEGRRVSQVAKSPGNIAVIPVRGVISNRMSLMSDLSQLGASAEQIEQKILAAYNDDTVKAIVLDVDSPGGAAAGTPELANTIRSLRGDKPIIAQVNALSASAAYWIASAADEIVSVPSGQIGSIGVITIHEDISAMLENEGVKETVITSSKYKGEGNPYEPLSDEAREYTQSIVDEYDSMFVKAVAEGRGVKAADVKANYGQGRLLTAQNALSIGMIDRIGTMRETLTRLGAKYDQDKRTRANSPSRSPGILRRRLQLEAEKA